LVGEKFEESVVQAQALSRSVGDEPTLRAGQPSTSSDAVGTFDYMSPEQREGRVADARSDIYAMGAILYELLTGRKVVGALAPPSRLRPGLNPAWDDIIIVRCLAYEPGERYATAGELARAIEGVTFQTLETCPPQAGQPAAPVSSRVCETGSLAANPRKANKQAIIIGAIVAGVAGLLVMGGLMWWRMGSVQRPVLPEEKLARGMPTKQLAPVMKSTLASKTSATLSPGPGAPIPTGKIFQDPDIDRVEPIPQPRPASTAAVVQAKSVQPGDGTHQAGDIMVVDLGGGVKLEFVWIPPGRFLMGSPANEECNYRNEGPQHQVIIASGFWMGKTEVTQRQYEQLVGENPSSFKGADLPVDHVDRNQSKAFCEKLQARLPAEMRGKTARLPTEAEWEYACRAGSKGAYAGALDKMGWYDQNSGNTTHPVGQKQANAWGLYDMHGNVWEWCWDGMRDYATSAVTDPKGADSSCVIRGGSWCNYAHFCRSAYRGDVGSHLRKSDLGFRVVVR
jgi:formylglycine-generating enzyme required for sulfatase activity